MDDPAPERRCAIAKAAPRLLGGRGKLQSFRRQRFRRTIALRVGGLVDARRGLPPGARPDGSAIRLAFSRDPAHQLHVLPPFSTCRNRQSGSALRRSGDLLALERLSRNKPPPLVSGVLPRGRCDCPP